MIKLEIQLDPGEIDFDKRLLRRTLVAAGREVANRAKALMRSSPASGRVYSVHGNKHAASAPGEPPSVLSGALMRSIKVKARRNGESVSIRETAPYGLFLETGASKIGGGKKRRHRRRIVALPESAMRMLARPALPIALDQVRPEITRRVIAAVDNGLSWKQTRGR